MRIFPGFVRVGLLTSRKRRRSDDARSLAKLSTMLILHSNFKLKSDRFRFDIIFKETFMLFRKKKVIAPPAKRWRERFTENFLASEVYFVRIGRGKLIFKCYFRIFIHCICIWETLLIAVHVKDPDCIMVKFNIGVSYEQIERSEA